MAPFESIYQLQLPWIQSLQHGFGPGALPVFKALSAFGEDLAYLLVLSALWAAGGSRAASRTAILLFVSFYLNSVLKDGLGHPRPFQLAPELGLGTAQGHGLPSGHAQSSLLFWLMMARFYPRNWVRALGTLLVAGVALSRVYLGVHFPTDILGGWLLAGALVWTFWRVAPAIESNVGRLEPKFWIRIAALFSGLALLLHPTGVGAASIGAFFGLVSGLALESVRPAVGSVSAAAGGSRTRVSQKVLAVLVAWAGAALVYFGLKSLFPGEGEPGYLLFRSLRYALLCLWVSAGVPSALRALPQLSSSDQRTKRRSSSA